MIMQFDEYVKEIIKGGSFMPGAFMMIPLLSINADGKAEGDPVAMEWAKEAFEFITKKKNA